jgi:hypothetical protein
MKYFYTCTFLLISFLSQAQLDFRLNLDDLKNQKTALNIEMGADKFSIELGTRFLLGPWATIEQTDPDGNIIPFKIKRFAYVGTLRANFYTNPNTSLDGFVISPTLDYMRQKVKFDDPTINNRIGASIMFGYKYLIGESKFAVQAETGLGYWFMDRTRLKSTGAKPEGEAFLESGGLAIFKNLRALRAPFNITVNYRIGE